MNETLLGSYISQFGLGGGYVVDTHLLPCDTVSFSIEHNKILANVLTLLSTEPAPGACSHLDWRRPLKPLLENV